VTSSGRALDTSVVNSQALLPEPPDYWSYSSLKQMGECPKRYALERADYPELWGRRGYPTSPTAPILFGNVVHIGLEAVVKALARAGVESLSAPEATEVLRGLGGLTAIVEKAMSKQLQPLANNPRLDQDRRGRISRELQALVPEARVQVQTYLSRTTFAQDVTLRNRPRSNIPSGSYERRALAKGSHAEVRLIAKDLRLLGRIDLLIITNGAVEIVDYKTGAESPDHQDQLRTYALLWDRDEIANPDRLPSVRLTAAYRWADASVDVPSGSELDSLSERLASAVDRADSELQSGTPTPIPSASNCGRCPVRQLCDAYWKTIAPNLSDVGADEWFDYEGVIGQQNGQRSWWIGASDADRHRFLLRTPTATPPFAVGDRVRFLGLRLVDDPEMAEQLATLTSSSEVYRLVVGH
jgi:hypothetical protein